MRPYFAGDEIPGGFESRPYETEGTGVAMRQTALSRVNILEVRFPVIRERTINHD